MRSFRASSRVLGPIVLLLISTWALAACDAAADPPKLKAGVVTPKDLPGHPDPKLLHEDRGVVHACDFNGENLLQDYAADTYVVEYALDDETTVRSVVYTFTGRHLARLDQHWDYLRSGNERCPKSPPDDPSGNGYKVLGHLPATVTGYDTTYTNTDPGPTPSYGDFVHSQRVWARRGTDRIVSVSVEREMKEADPPLDLKLPVDVLDLTLKVARRGA